MAATLPYVCRRNNNSFLSCSSSRSQSPSRRRSDRNSKNMSEEERSYVGMFFASTSTVKSTKNRQQNRHEQQDDGQKFSPSEQLESSEVNVCTTGTIITTTTTNNSDAYSTVSSSAGSTIDPSYSYRPAATFSKNSRPPTRQLQTPFYLGMPPPRRNVPSNNSNSMSKSSSVESSVIGTPPTPQLYHRNNFKPPPSHSKPAFSNNKGRQNQTKFPPVVGSAGATFTTSTYSAPSPDSFSLPAMRSYEDGTPVPSKLNGFGANRISVALRIRPMETREISCLQIIPPKLNTVLINSGATLRSFDFDKVFGPDQNQDDIFEEMRMKQFIENAISGYSCSVFCYGQTGAGKTHTLIGPPLGDGAFDDNNAAWYTQLDRSQFGLIPRCIACLFSCLQKQRPSSYHVTFSAVQIYNEQLVDMFGMQKPLDIRWSRNAGFFIDGVSRFNCTNTREAITLLYQVRFGAYQSPPQQRRRVKFEDQPSKRDQSNLADNSSGSISLGEDADISSLDDGKNGRLALELDYDYETWESYRNSQANSPQMVKNVAPPPNQKPYKTQVLREEDHDLGGVAWSPFDDEVPASFYPSEQPPRSPRQRQTVKADNNSKPPIPATYRLENPNQPRHQPESSRYGQIVSPRQHHNSEQDHEPSRHLNNNILSEPSSANYNENNRQNPMMLNKNPQPQIPPPAVQTRPNNNDFTKHLKNNGVPHQKISSANSSSSNDQHPGLYSYLLTEDRKKIVGPFKVNLDQEEIYQVKNPPPDPPPDNERSHAVFSVGIENNVEQNNGNGDDAENSIVVVRRGKLTFVDLAGSEKNSDIEDQQREANNINKGLLVLGKCIQALSKDELGHVPYRDSKLTKVLADSLGGQSFTVMIACISPSKSNIAETLTTLRYAGRARLIRTDPALRMNPLEQMMSGLHHELKLLRAENEQLRQHLNSVKGAKPESEIQLPQNGNGNNNNDNNSTNNNEAKEPSKPPVGGSNKKNVDKKPSDRQDNDFYDMLQEFMVENENLRQENSELQRTRDKVLEDCERIGRENENLKKQIGDVSKMVGNEPGAGKKRNKSDKSQNNRQDNGNNETNGRVALPNIPSVPGSNSNGGHYNNNLPAASNNDDNTQGHNNNANNRAPLRRNTFPHQGGKHQNNNNPVHPPPLPELDDVGPLMPPPPSKVSNYPYSIPSPLTNGFHSVKQVVRVPPPIDEVTSAQYNDRSPPQLQPQSVQLQQFQAQPQQPPRQMVPVPVPSQRPGRFIEPQVESTLYTGRETNRKANMRRSPIMKVALPAVLRPPVFYGQEPPPTNAEIAIRENEQLSQELKDLDRLIRHHYH